MRVLKPLSPGNVRIGAGLWGPRVRTNRRVTIPLEYRLLKQTGRYDAWQWRRGRGEPPHIFWDSDVAKWVEAGAYALMAGPDPVLERRIDTYVRMLAVAQARDGYLNSHFQRVEPGRRWRNLRDEHELYCAGHLIEAAVAYHAATGKRLMLDVLCRYADHIARTFGRGPGRRRGCCGHPEIELALVKLFRATGERRYLDLAAYFVDERGTRPNCFGREARARGERGAPWFGGLDYLQAHQPVRLQRDAVGHAVRAVYLYSGMADVAAERGDRALLAACRRLFASLTRRRMYVTGGIGSTAQGERFTVDHDLPNDTAYAETCAAIGLAMFAQRMANAERDGRYADVMERALYNGMLAGVSLDGRRFFYANPLAVWPPALPSKGHVARARQKWFGCACCPPNVARLLSSLASYAYASGGRELRVHLFVDSTVTVDLAGQRVSVRQATEYPWNGRVEIEVRPDRPVEFALAVRIPGWCRRASLTVAGRTVDLRRVTVKGYAVIRRQWRPGDRVRLTLDMPVEQVEAHPAVRQDCGRVALQRGPLVYCLEECDNGPYLHDILLDRSCRWQARRKPGFAGGTVVLTGRGWRREMKGWKDALYRTERSRLRRVSLTAVPYALWGNRRAGEMVVWVGR